MMKTLVLFATLVISYNSFSACQLFLHNSTPLKENEKSVLYDVSFKLFRQKSYILTNYIHESDYLATLAFTPVLKDKEFIYKYDLTVSNKSGEFIKETVYSQNLKQGFEKVIGLVPDCMDF